MGEDFNWKMQTLIVETAMHPFHFVNFPLERHKIDTGAGAQRANEKENIKDDLFFY